MSDFWDGIELDQIGDVLKATIVQLGPQDPIRVLKYGRYEYMNGIHTRRVSTSGGVYAIDRSMILDDTGNASWTLPYDSAQPEQRDVAVKMRSPWGEARTHFSISTEEMRALDGEAALYNEVEERDRSATADLCNLLENDFWSAYDSDPKKAYPMDYWLPQIASTQTAGDYGFYGGHALTVGGEVGGIAAATSGDNTDAIAGGKERWRCWQGAYTSGDYDTILDLLNIARLQCNLDIPIQISGVPQVGGDADPRAIYMGLGNFNILRQVAEQYAHTRVDIKVDNTGKLMFYDVPIIYVPQMNAASRSREPIYFTNNNTFMPKVRAGLDWKRKGPMDHVTQPLVFTTFNFVQFQNLMLNRKANAVLATV